MVVDRDPDTGVFSNDRATPCEDLRIGDLVRVRPGEVVPGDGEVRSRAHTALASSQNLQPQLSLCANAYTYAQGRDHAYIFHARPMQTPTCMTTLTNTNTKPTRCKFRA